MGFIDALREDEPGVGEWGITGVAWPRLSWRADHEKVKMKMNTDELMKAPRVDLLIAILVLGSLWGFSEVVLSSAIMAAGIPYRAGILTGVGMGLMGVALGAFRKPLLPAGMALVAVLCKQLVVPILHVSVMCEANSCVAVMLDGLALAGVAALAGRRLDKGYPAKIAVGAAAALVAAAAFHVVGMRVAPCQHLLSFNRAGGFVAFVTSSGLVWAFFSAILFPLGCLVGTRFRNAVPALRTRKPLFYYTVSAALVVCCWAASAVVIAAEI
jgi:hypothetical protein